jgi:hypothetical protein
MKQEAAIFDFACASKRATNGALTFLLVTFAREFARDEITREIEPTITRIHYREFARGPHCTNYDFNSLMACTARENTLILRGRRSSLYSGLVINWRFIARSHASYCGGEQLRFFREGALPFPFITRDKK